MLVDGMGACPQPAGSTAPSGHAVTMRKSIRSASTFQGLCSGVTLRSNGAKLQLVRSQRSQTSPLEMASRANTTCKTQFPSDGATAAQHHKRGASARPSNPVVAPAVVSVHPLLPPLMVGSKEPVRCSPDGAYTYAYSRILSARLSSLPGPRDVLPGIQKCRRLVGVLLRPQSP